MLGDCDVEIGEDDAWILLECELDGVAEAEFEWGGILGEGAGGQGEKERNPQHHAVGNAPGLPLETQEIVEAARFVRESTAHISAASGDSQRIGFGGMVGFSGFKNFISFVDSKRVVGFEPKF